MLYVVFIQKNKKEVKKMETITEFIDDAAKGPGGTIVEVKEEVAMALPEQERATEKGKSLRELIVPIEGKTPIVLLTR